MRLGVGVYRSGKVWSVLIVKVSMVLSVSTLSRLRVEVVLGPSMLMLLSHRGDKSTEIRDISFCKSP